VAPAPVSWFALPAGGQALALADDPLAELLV
jgi:hypothetical protein